MTLRSGSDISAIGVYAYFHLSAAAKASRLASEALDPAQRQTLARAALADEAFALHSTLGRRVRRPATLPAPGAPRRNARARTTTTTRTASRCSPGRAVRNRVVLMGDASHAPRMLKFAAETVRESLAQVIDVAFRQRRWHGVSAHAGRTSASPAHLRRLPQQHCAAAWARARTATRSSPVLRRDLGRNPVPSLGPGLGSMPRFRSEVGLFMGLAGSIDIRHLDGGFVSGQTAAGHQGGLDLSFRARVRARRW